MVKEEEPLLGCPLLHLSKLQSRFNAKVPVRAEHKEDVCEVSKCGEQWKAGPRKTGKQEKTKSVPQTVNVQKEKVIARKV